MDLFQPEPVIWIQTMMGPAWQGTMDIVTALLGGAWGIILVAGLAFWLWGRPALYGVLAVLAAETVVKKVLAAIFIVPRPEASSGIVKYEQVPGVSSFPSGHVSSATGLWGALAFLGHIPLLVALLAAFVAGLSRLYLGVHWVADVVAAIALGLGLAWAVTRFHGPLMRWLEDLPSTAWWIGGGALVAVAVAGLAFWIGDNRFAWTTAGFTGGLGLSLPVERRWVRYRPAHASRRDAILKGLVGVAGLIPFFVVARLAGPSALALKAAMAFGATLWALLAAPTLFAARETS